MNKSFNKIVAAVISISLLVSLNQLQVRADGTSLTVAYENVFVADAEEATTEEATTEKVTAETSNSDEAITGENDNTSADDTTMAADAGDNEVSEEDMSFTEKIAAKFANSLGKYVPDWVIVLLVSMMPLLELRAGLFVAKFLNFDIRVAIPICVIGNIIPIPFILLFIKKIFKWMGKTKLFHKLIEKLEARAMKKSSALSKGEFLGLVLFVGIPIPGTGAWMGSLIAALLEIDIKKAIAAELVGIVIATVIVSILSYGLLGFFI